LRHVAPPRTPQEVARSDGTETPTLTVATRGEVLFDTFNRLAASRVHRRPERHHSAKRYRVVALSRMPISTSPQKPALRGPPPPDTRKLFNLRAGLSDIPDPQPGVVQRMRKLREVVLREARGMRAGRQLRESTRAAKGRPSARPTDEPLVLRAARPRARSQGIHERRYHAYASGACPPGPGKI